MAEYAVNIGLEVHIQLNTVSKAFCADSTAFGQPPNQQVSAISLAYPGTLPKINSQQIYKAIQLALALNSAINERSYFDRKSYFYPDLPKGYQITQDNVHYCKGGYLDVEIEGQTKTIQIHHIHMEEDAGKSIHTLDEANTLIDLNRAGTPLLELVTEPFISSADEALTFLTELRSLVRYLGISDGNMEEGSMRADCNVSLRPVGSNQLGERREVKNVNSLKFAKKAIEYEIKKQKQILDQGGTIRQSTMDYDPIRNITIPLRDKEDAHDYRYFPDPDLPPLIITKTQIDEVRLAMPTDPKTVQLQLMEEYKISKDHARIFTYDLELRGHFKTLAHQYLNYQKLANLYSNKIIPRLQQQSLQIANLGISDKQLIGLLKLVDTNEVSASMAYQKVFPALIGSQQSAREITESLDLLMSNDTDESLESMIKDILNQNPDKVKAYKNGKKGLLGFFMGQAMKASGGKLNPKNATEILQRMLDSQ